MTKRATFLLLLLVLLVAPAANLWCSTVCVAAAISAGCAHGLQPSDDLPMERAGTPETVTAPVGIVQETEPARGPSAVTPAPERHTPLRI